MRTQRVPASGGNRNISIPGGRHDSKSRDRGAPASEYEHVRLLYRGYDHGVTAVAETAEQKQARIEQCKTTGSVFHIVSCSESPAG